MIKRKRFAAVLAPLAALVVGVLALAPANAATGDDIYSCVFEGTTTNLTPINSILQELQGDHTPGGTYRFVGGSVGGAPTCVYVDGDRDQANAASWVQAVSSSIVSTGTFTNQICGSGQATGDEYDAANSKGTTLTSPRGVVKPEYTINFTGGVGTLDVTGGVDGLGQSLDGGGVVDLLPANHAATECTIDQLQGFDVRGSFTAYAL